MKIIKREETVPETFEELTNLCKNFISDTFKVSHDSIGMKVNNGWMFFDISGDIVCEPSCVIISEKRTPAQLFQIIKSLKEN